MGGKVRHFLFNLGSDVILCKGMNITLDEFSECIAGSRQIEFLIWVHISGLYNYLERNGDQEGLDELGDSQDLYHNLVDWIEDVNEKDSGKVMNAFIQARVLKGRDKGDTSKKKSPLKKSKTPESES